MTRCLLILLALASTASATTTVEVRDGESIQKAVNEAEPGTTILIYPGTYKETVYIDKDGITLRGVVEEGNWPVLEGEGHRNDAVLYSGNGITVERLKITHYKGNGIMGQAGNNFTIRYNWIDDTGVYGIFPEFGKNGLIEYNVLRGIEDAAIYVGMCDNIDVRHNEVYENVAGIEIENTRHAIVENNYVHDNTGGILAFITPGLPIKTAFDIIIRDNFVVDNNTPNFGAPGSIVAGIPAGTGILVMAADDVKIEGNIVTGNNTAGVILTDFAYAANVSNDPESEPNPDNVAIYDNFFANNGNDAEAEVKALLMAKALTTQGPDIIAVGGATDSDNCIIGVEAHRTIGLDDWQVCTETTTADTLTYLLPEPVPPRDTNEENKASIVYKGICAGCHAYNVRMIGPPTMVVQALYRDDPQALADYIADPTKKRDDYPEMPPQNYLSPELRLDVAKEMLGLER